MSDVVLYFTGRQLGCCIGIDVLEAMHVRFKPNTGKWARVGKDTTNVKMRLLGRCCDSGSGVGWYCE